MLGRRARLPSPGDLAGRARLDARAAALRKLHGQGHGLAGSGCRQPFAALLCATNLEAALNQRNRSPGRRRLWKLYAFQKPLSPVCSPLRDTDHLRAGAQ